MRMYMAGEWPDPGINCLVWVVDKEALSECYDKHPLLLPGAPVTCTCSAPFPCCILHMLLLLLSQMANFERAEELLEELRSSSYAAAEVRATP